MSKRRRLFWSFFRSSTAMAVDRSTAVIGAESDIVPPKKRGENAHQSGNRGKPYTQQGGVAMRPATPSHLLRTHPQAEVLVI
jgi:hypothetical protein